MIYTWLNNRGTLLGIHWTSPGIYLPIAVYPYVFGMIILIIFPFIFNLTSPRFYGLLLIYTAVSIIIFTIYLIYPVYMLRQEYTGTLFADKLMRCIVGLDDPANCFPSNHCALATLGYIGVRISNIALWVKHSTLVLTILVCLSTVLVGQHYWIDIPAGILLSILTYFLFTKIIKLKVVS
jgi:membrane-associated phospholipid phosphatase